MLVAWPWRLSSLASQRPCCASVTVTIHPGFHCHAPLSPSPELCLGAPAQGLTPFPLAWWTWGHAKEQGGGASCQGTAQVVRALHK